MTFLYGLAEKTWKVLESAIHEINNQNASGLSFEELYRHVLLYKSLKSRQSLGPECICGGMSLTL